MKREALLKWRITAIVVAAIAGYAIHDETRDLASTETIPVICAAASQPAPARTSASAAEAEKNNKCSQVMSPVGTQKIDA